LFGQGTKGEAEEVLDYIPHSDKLELSKREVQTMPVGFAIVSTKSWAKRTYVRPTWVPAETAVRIAQGRMDPRDVLKFERRAREAMDEDERKRYETQIEQLKGQIESFQKAQTYLEQEKTELQRRLEAATKPQVIEISAPTSERVEQTLAQGEMHEKLPGIPGILEGDIDLDTLVTKVADRLASDEYRVNLKLAVPELHVKQTVHTVDATEHDNVGRIGILVLDGFLGSPRTIPDLQKEFRQRGWGAWSGGAGKNNMLNLATKFARMGFVRVDGDTVTLVDGVKKRIHREED
jgi:hypothetical protein